MHGARSAATEKTSEPRFNEGQPSGHAGAPYQVDRRGSEKSHRIPSQQPGDQGQRRDQDHLPLEVDDIKGDVIHVIPPMRAAKLTELAGARPAECKQAWCPVDFRTFESKTVPNVHILGDSSESNMPKAGAVANNTGKMCAAASRGSCR